MQNLLSPPIASVIIPAFNEQQYIGEALDSLLNSQFDHNQLEIIVVDNGSTDNTVAIANSKGVRVEIQPNIKVGAVRNRGARLASGKYLIFLDSDCVVSPLWILNGIQQLEENETLVLGGQYLTRAQPSWLERYWALSNSTGAVHLTTLVGGCIFIRKDTFLDVGGFDESLNSGEDSEITSRLKNKGYSVKIDAKMSIIHLGFPSKIIPFIKRQLWHSADYSTSIRRSLTDKIFLVTILFFLCFMAAFMALIFNAIGLALIFIAFFLACPAALSIKRIARAKLKNISLFDGISIYLVDCLYLIGRVLGVLVSAKNRLLKTNRKVSRR